MISDKLKIRQTGFVVEPLDGKNGIGILEVSMKIMNGVGINNRYGGGTLLGMYRDGKLIPHDTDLDVDVCVTNTIELSEQLDKLVDLMKVNGFRVIRQQTYEDKPMQLAFIQTTDNIIFDIYFYYDLGAEGSFVNVNEHGILFYPKAYWNGEMTTDTYLSLRYGKDWKTPQSAKGKWEEDAKRLMVLL